MVPDYRIGYEQGCKDYETGCPYCSHLGATADFERGYHDGFYAKLNAPYRRFDAAHNPPPEASHT